MAYKDPKDPRKKESSAKHYQRNKDVYKSRAKEKKKELKEYVRSLKNVPCNKCKKRFPHYVMDFHHTEEKDKGVSELCRYGSKKRIDEEVTKCIILCANCHRIEHNT